MLKVKIGTINKMAKMNPPVYATLGSAGMDLIATVDKAIEIKPGAIAKIPTGIKIALPFGYEAQVRSRSGLAYKHGVVVLNSPGTIDSDYRGEICILLINHGKETFTVEPGMRVAQMVIAKHETVEWEFTSELEETERGEGGLGSTGIFSKKRAS